MDQEEEQVTGHLQKKLRKNPRGVGMKKEEEKAVWKKLAYTIWRVLWSE